MIQVFPTSAPQDEATTNLIHHLRSDVVPEATKGTDMTVYVGGFTAASQDFADVLSSRLPLFIGAVLGLSFLLLLVVFRSIVVPLKAVIMNLLSIAAAYGVIVAVFQWGWLSDVFGVGKPGPIEAWAPMMLFAIVFGLSMDYEVFLLSRIKEEYDRTGDNGQAVADGLASTARRHHRCRRDHDLRLRQLRPRRSAPDQAHRPRASPPPCSSTRPSCAWCSCRRRWSCSATATGGSRSGSTASCPGSRSRPTTSIASSPS